MKRWVQIQTHVNHDGNKLSVTDTWVWIAWLTTPVLEEQTKKNKRKIVNIVAEIKEKTLDRLLIVNCYFVALPMFLSFQLGPNSEIATFVGHAPLILQCQGTSYF